MRRVKGVTQSTNERAARQNGTGRTAEDSRRPQSTTATTDGKGELPQFLKDLIACCPQHGQGVHQWLFKCARQLFAHRDKHEIVSLAFIAAIGKPADEGVAACAFISELFQGIPLGDRRKLAFLIVWEMAGGAVEVELEAGGIAGPVG